MPGMIQGQSVSTIDKERRIGSVLSTNMLAVSRSKLAGRGYTYWHLDANSGSGFNDTVGVPGSPAVYFDAEARCLRGFDSQPFFCDKDEDKMRQLQQALGPLAARSILLPGDNEEALEVFAEYIRQRERPRFAVGSLLIDPNNYQRNLKGEGPPSVTALRRFTEEFRSLDVVLSLNYRTYQMQKGRRHQVISPRDLLVMLNKEHWVIGHTAYGGDKFLLGIGRNHPIGDHPRVGLFKAESETGRYILDVVEGKRQGELALSDLSRISAPSRVPGGAKGGDAARQGALSMRRDSNRSPPSPLPAVGHVRPAIELAADMPRLPLPGAREE